jgi:phage baseplate assembly protein W
MAGAFYKTPLQLSKLLQGNELPNCSMAESITQNLDLIIMTRFGEHRANPSFGCEIWELDFELIISERLWEEKLRQSLLKSISTHELRLSDIEINVSIREIEKFHYLKQMTEIKKQVNIQLEGSIHKTGEAFGYNTNLFLSPLSVD